MYNAADVERITEIVIMIVNLEDEGWTFEKIQNAVQQVLEEGEPEPEPEPNPDVAIYRVTAEKTNARFAWKTNAAGRPIMQIYPADNSAVKDRVQFVKGTKVKVLRDVVKSDGGTMYYEIAEKVWKNGVLVSEALYLLLKDGVLE